MQPVSICLLRVAPCDPCAGLFPCYVHPCRKPGAYINMLQGEERVAGKGGHLWHLCFSSTASLPGLAV